MNTKNNKLQLRNRRRTKIRAKIKGDGNRPRFSVFRSNTGMYVQLIDDNKGITLVSAHSREIKPTTGKSRAGAKKAETAQFALETELGELIAKKALAKKIKAVVFDRGGYKYHGRVKAVAEGARAGGLNF